MAFDVVWELVNKYNAKKVRVYCPQAEEDLKKERHLEDVEKAIDEERIEINYGWAVDRRSDWIDDNDGDGWADRIQLTECLSFDPFKLGKKKQVVEGMDEIIIALGQKFDYLFLGEDKEKMVDEYKRLVVTQERTTKKEGVFAGGDVRLPGLAAEAIRDAFQVALRVHLEAMGNYVSEEQLRDKRRIPAPLGDLAEECKVNKSSLADWVYGLIGKCAECGNCKACGACLHRPVVTIDEVMCRGCGECVEVCPFGAAVLDNDKGTSKRLFALCVGCGSCAVVCPNNSISIKNCTTDQISAMIKSALNENEEVISNA